MVASAIGALTISFMPADGAGVAAVGGVTLLFMPGAGAAAEVVGGLEASWRAAGGRRGGERWGSGGRHKETDVESVREKSKNTYMGAYLLQIRHHHITHG